MKKLFAFTLIVVFSSLSFAQDEGSFCISAGANYLFGDLADSNNNGFELGIVSKVPIAEQGLFRTLVTGISYIKLPWNEDIKDPERSGHVISTSIGAIAGNMTGLNVISALTMNFGMFNQGFLGAEMGVGYGMKVGAINKIVDVSLKYSVFNAVNVVKEWHDMGALDLVRFNVTMAL